MTAGVRHWGRGGQLRQAIWRDCGKLDLNVGGAGRFWIRKQFGQDQLAFDGQVVSGVAHGVWLGSKNMDSRGEVSGWTINILI